MAVFTEHYRENSWGDDESVSGRGSRVDSTVAIRAAMPALIEDLKIQTLLDIPCGDFNWMRLLDLPVRYIGADVVQELVAENQRRFGSARRFFLKLDLTADPLPEADLILCRDCFIHLSFDDISRALANIKRSKARFLLVTNHHDLDQNEDIVTGEWRRVNLQRPPFSFPKPLMQISEQRSGKEVTYDKSLALWEISAL